MLRRLFFASIPASLADLVSLPKRVIADRVNDAKPPERKTWGRSWTLPTADTGRMVTIGFLFVPSAEVERWESKGQSWKNVGFPKEFGIDYKLVLRVTEGKFD